MDINNTLKLLNKYGKCPNCGEERLGNGYGTLSIDDFDFKRTCKCGFSVEVKVDKNNKIIKEIKKMRREVI